MRWLSPSCPTTGLIVSLSSRNSPALAAAAAAVESLCWEVGPVAPGGMSVPAGNNEGRGKPNPQSTFRHRAASVSAHSQPSRPIACVTAVAAAAGLLLMITHVRWALSGVEVL
jgi:hypothetical protein